MKKSRFTEEQILAALAEGDAGASGAELARRHGISRQTFIRWKAKYGGLQLKEARRLRQLEDENRRLKTGGRPRPRQRHAQRRGGGKKW